MPDRAERGPALAINCKLGPAVAQGTGLRNRSERLAELDPERLNLALNPHVTAQSRHRSKCDRQTEPCSIGRGSRGGDTS